MTRPMTFESGVTYCCYFYIWLPPASYVVFLTTLVDIQVSRSKVKVKDKAYSQMLGKVGHYFVFYQHLLLLYISRL